MDHRAAHDLPRRHPGGIGSAKWAVQSQSCRLRKVSVLSCETDDPHGTALLSPTQRQQIPMLIVVFDADRVIAHDLGPRSACSPAQVLILGPDQKPLVEATDLDEQPSPHAQVARGHRERVCSALRALAVGFLGLCHLVRPQAKPSQGRLRQDDAEVWVELTKTGDDAVLVLLPHGHMSPDVVGTDDAVIVHEHEEVPPGQSRPMVSGRRNAAVRLPRVPNPRKSRHRRCRRVGGSVIHHQDLEQVVGILE